MIKTINLIDPWLDNGNIVKHYTHTRRMEKKTHEYDI